MPHTEGIDNVVIFWDDDDGEYNAGQLLTGRIEVQQFFRDFMWITAFLGPCAKNNFIQRDQTQGLTCLFIFLPCLL